jgi:Zn-dependent protease with chaperone function
MNTTNTNKINARFAALQAPGVLLYAATLAGQLVAAFARGLIATISLEFISWISGWPIPVEPIALVIAFGPLAVSLLCLLAPPLMAPINGRWWEMTTGGRPPEQDEQEAFDNAISELQEFDPNVRPPRHWFVAEEPGHNAAAYAASLRVDRGLLESPYAAATIGHELGHLRTSDARLTSALNLLLILPMETPEIRPLRTLPFRGLFWIASGQAVLWFLGNAWEMYWRSREFAADEYAARLGQGPALANSLEQTSLPYERSIQRMRFSRASHPYTKPRIAKLRAFQPDRTAGDQE